MNISQEHIEEKDSYKNLRQDLLIVTMSVFIAIGIVRWGVVEDVVSRINELKIIGSFIAGLFFTSAFTVAPAAIALAEIAKSLSPTALAFWGACGAMIGDTILFLFVRDRFSKDILEFLHLFKNERKIKRFFKQGFFRWLSPLVGLIILATPLPNEFAIALFSMSKIQKSTFILISFVMNFIAILLIALVSHAL